MQAAIRTRYGSPDVVELRDVDRPTPTDGEVLVRVHAASVNRADLDGIQPRPAFVRLFLGLAGAEEPPARPRRRGRRRVGRDGRDPVHGGRRVFADLYPFGQGAFAEYACAPERAFESIPDGMSFEDAPPSRTRRSSRSRDCGCATVGRPSRATGCSSMVPRATSARSPSRSRSRWVRRSPASAARRRWTSCARSAPTTSSTTRRWTTRATGERYDWIVDTDSHHPILRIRRALRPNGVYVTLGGTAGRPRRAVVRAARLAGHRSLVGLMLWWKPFKADGRRDAHGR